MGFFGASKSATDSPAAPNTPTSQTRMSGAPARPDGSIGIDHAIQLMRSLPQQNIELVVTVMKATLESLNIKVVDIVRDATQRQREIEARVGALKVEIQNLEKEMETRLTEIRHLEAMHQETTRVKERLEGKSEPIEVLTDLSDDE